MEKTKAEKSIHEYLLKLVDQMAEVLGHGNFKEKKKKQESRMKGSGALNIKSEKCLPEFFTLKNL